MDTDSLLGFPSLPSTCNYLGQLTNEFLTGPKNYGFRTRRGKTSHMVCGFSHNERTASVLNFGSIRTLVTDEMSSPKDSVHKIVWDSETKAIPSNHK